MGMTDGGALVLLEHPTGTAGSPGKPRLSDPADPHLHLDDLGVLRGYGAFEVVHGIDRKVIAAEDHLSRLDRSCARLSLPRIHRAAWREAMDFAVRTHDEEGEFALRLVLTGGTGAAESMRGWIRYERVAESFVVKRSRSLRATLLDRGIAAGCADQAPWLLIGVKSLSYGPNMAAIQEAQRRGADEAVYVSSDGYVLEAPTSSVVIRQGDTLIAPEPSQGILPGTTHRALFAEADKLGLDVRYDRVHHSRLASADGMWLTASMRLATPLGDVDGTKIPVDLDLTERMNRLLLASAKPVLPGAA